MTGAGPAIQPVGLLIPSSNTTVEHEYNRFGPAALSWHAGRVRFTALRAEALAAQEGALAEEAAKLATASVVLGVMAQSAIGFVAGLAAERALAARLAGTMGVPVLSAAEAMAAALRALGVRRIALAMPFDGAVGGLAEGYFTASGFACVGRATLGITHNAAVAEVTEARLVALARAADAPGGQAEAEAVVIPGGNLRAMAAIAAMEAALGKPVVVTNQACLWAVAGVLGVATGAGLPGRLAGADPGGVFRRGLAVVGAS
jgi:maleate isomerase